MSSPGTPDPAAGSGHASLREGAISGIRWIGIARIAAQVTSVGAAVILAHLVPPAQFGLLATAVVVREFALMTANEGIGSPLVQRKVVDRAHLEAGGALALLSGMALTLLTYFVVAPLIARPVYGPESEHLFRLFSPTFVLSAFLIVPLAMLQRRLAFREVALVEVLSVLTTSVMSVVLAFAGLNATAYVFGMLAGLLVLSVGYTIVGRPPRPRWHGREVRQILGFGVPSMGAGIAAVAYRNADYLIVGARLGPLAAGYYYRAFTLGVEYETKISGIVSRIAFPVYARTRDLDHLRAVRERIMRMNAIIVWPFLAFFIVVAPQLVPWAFGTRWEPAVVPAQILAVAGMAQTLRSGTSPLLLAAGRPRPLLYLSIAELIGYVGVVLFATGHGLTAVALGVSGFQVGTLLLAYRFVVGPIVGVGVRRLILDVGSAGTACAAVIAAGAALRPVFAGGPVLVELVVLGATSATVYLLVLRFAFPAAWSDVTMLGSNLLRRRRPPTAVVAAAPPEPAL